MKARSCSNKPSQIFCCVLAILFSVHITDYRYSGFQQSEKVCSCVNIDLYDNADIMSKDDKACPCGGNHNRNKLCKCTKDNCTGSTHIALQG